MAKRGRPKKEKKSSINLIPMPGYVLVKPIETETKTQSGIYLPDLSSEEKPLKGEVLAVGSDETTEFGIKRSSPVAVGDTVIYKKWGGSEVKIDGKDLLFAKFEDILAIQK